MGLFVGQVGPLGAIRTETAHLVDDDLQSAHAPPDHAGMVAFLARLEELEDAALIHDQL